MATYIVKLVIDVPDHDELTATEDDIFNGLNKLVDSLDDGDWNGGKFSIAEVWHPEQTDYRP